MRKKEKKAGELRVYGKRTAASKMQNCEGAEMHKQPFGAHKTLKKKVFLSFPPACAQACSCLNRRPVSHLRCRRAIGCLLGALSCDSRVSLVLSAK